ncbi:MAG TPA: type II secretion system protein GspJ [Urbifossiella sp.]|nr:type II secretion system protein GspJ [Urbifossiella sp.]
MRLTPTRRRGFTLLEVMLASLIAIFLLAALYFAMDVTLRRTTESREALEVDNLSRAAFNRINLDLASALGPLPPKSGGNSAAGAPPTPAPADDGAAEATVAAPKAADISFQAGVVGTDKSLTIFASGLPNALAYTGELANPTTAQAPSDLRRITYWLRTGGGLCRQERPWVTADGVRNSADPDLSDEDGDTLVEEVTDVTFEYWDGTGWTTSWDGSSPAADGVTPTGPPRAIRVTLVFEVPSNRPNQPPVKQTAVQVIRVPSAPGPVTPTMVEPSTDSGMVTPESATADPAAGAQGAGAQGAPGTQAVPGAPGVVGGQGGQGGRGGMGPGGMGPGGGQGGRGGAPGGGMGPGGGQGGRGGAGGAPGGMGPGGGRGGAPGGAAPGGAAGGRGGAGGGAAGGARGGR